MIPSSVLLDAYPCVDDTATHVEPFAATELKVDAIEPLFNPRVSAVQVTPSSVLLDAYPLCATATHVEPFAATELKAAVTNPLFNP